ncbi:retrovirus-related pol polyprotein from transposon TNT 1-94 [Tanacetum coccineum]
MAAGSKSGHRCFGPEDILIGIRPEIANPLSTLVAAQPYSYNYHNGASNLKDPNAPSYKQSSSTRSTATTRHKGKEIAKPVTPQSESVSEEDSDPEQARRIMDMQKNLALLAKTVHILGAKEIVGSPVVQKTGIQCFNCKGFGHYARECRKPKRVKDYAYHRRNDDVANKLNKVVSTSS